MPYPLPSATVRLFLYLIAFVSGLSAQAQVGLAGKVNVKYGYLAYVPASYQVTKVAYLLVIYLHGGSQRGNNLEKLTVYGPPHAVAQGAHSTKQLR